ncbi:TPA: hypothetical protein DIS56_01315 [Candidatus Saccharibacteria bacterium]|nr:MAG: hypothetical protein UX30_C0003G0063 [Candidatus Saccharibacteria bacterium GW2011_GWA2_46_10]OGL34362.1 MAG: hypothetical protein A3F05_02315 [Candidatus Saccharibacteria bacterium RIFCSPHIGHO2_12_FULL_47_17]HCM51753.1 hypothetical protein [Candidatus Saccharibacteria bacterium]
MKKIYADSISQAKSYYDGSTDVIHDLSHSERVIDNAKDIAGHLDYKDLDFLELCIYWHDAARAQGVDKGHEEAGAILAHDDLLNRGADEELAKRVYEAIRFHKSSDKPNTIEGKIIRDADKLEIYSPVRWQKCLQAGWNDYYLKELQLTIGNMPKYPGVFTYEYTKQLYKKRLKEFQNFLESVKSKLG